MLVAALFLSIRISYQLSNVFLVALPLLIVVVALILTKASPCSAPSRKRPTR